MYIFFERLYWTLAYFYVCYFHFKFDQILTSMLQQMTLEYNNPTVG